MPEIEAKFLVQRPKQLQCVLRALEDLGFSVERGSTESLEDSYFDTSDWVILRAGWAYRCRRTGAHETLGLKAIGGGDGPVFERDEIEQPLPSTPRTDGRLPAGPVSARLRKIINGHRSHEIFKVRSRRTLYEVSRRHDNPVTLELALDHSEIVASEESASDEPSHSLAFTELELELEEGSRRVLNDLARDLIERTGILPAQLSKFERGLHAAKLAEGRAPEPRRLSLDDRMLDLAFVYLRRQFAAMKVQAPRAWEGLEEEGVHRMRVAIRRMRAMLRALRDIEPADELADFNREFRWLAAALGHVRDTDVHTTELRRYVASLPDEDANELEGYRRYVRKQRRKARAALIEVLSGQRYKRLVGTFQRFLEDGASVTAGALSIGAGADALLKESVDKLLQSGRAIKVQSPPKKLHALRIRAKKLRYLLECFGDCHEDRFDAPLADLRHLQNVLGEYQDTAVAIRGLQDYAATRGKKRPDSRQLLALGGLIHAERHRAKKARRRFPKAWRNFERAAVGIAGPAVLADTG